MDIKLETKEVIDYFDCEKIVGVDDLGDFYFTTLEENGSYYCFHCSNDRIVDIITDLEECTLKATGYQTETKIKQLNNDLKLIYFIRWNYNLDKILVHIYW